MTTKRKKSVKAWAIENVGGCFTVFPKWDKSHVLEYIRKDEKLVRVEIREIGK